MSNQLKTITVTNAAAAAAVADFEISDEVKELLTKYGVSVHPPNTSVGDKSIEWEGRGFVLPALPQPMGLKAAGQALLEKDKEESEPVRVSELVDAMPWDGAQAFQKAVEFLFGWGITRPTPGFFGPNPPVLRSIKTGPGVNDVIQVFWGAVEIPAAGLTLQTGVGYIDERIVFQVTGTIPKGRRHILEGLIALTRIFARERSIYKGKAIRMWVDDEGSLEFEREPEFLETDIRTVSQLIFPKKTHSQIHTNLFTPIMYPDVCRQMGIPLKRTVLLGGPYGTGKTLTATAAAALAVNNGWTFIMINRVAGLQSVLDFAHRYAPVVVFAEDIDRATSGDERTVEIDDILNTLDGVQSKNHDIITVLTSNHAEQLNRAMVRPGRIDAVIEMELPDADAAERLIRLYGREWISANEDLTEAANGLVGQIPATIREAVEKAKLTAIGRVKGKPTDITSEDIVVATETMRHHLALLNSEIPDNKNANERLGEALSDVMRESVTNGAPLLQAFSQRAAAIADQVNQRLIQLTPTITQTHEKVMTTKAVSASTPAKN